MKYLTRFERFVTGDFPMVCVRSGLPATKLVPVQAYRSSAWPWFFVGNPLLFLVAKWVGDSDHPWGLLPFADGQVQGITATYDRRVGVILKGVHEDFVAATRQAQGKPSDRPDPAPVDRAVAGSDE
ncbi:MAG: hypothetical protein AAF547_02855 [Actinomycetota bacterium]